MPCALCRCGGRGSHRVARGRAGPASICRVLRTDVRVVAPSRWPGSHRVQRGHPVRGCDVVEVLLEHVSRQRRYGKTSGMWVSILYTYRVCLLSRLQSWVLCSVLATPVHLGNKGSALVVRLSVRVRLWVPTLHVSPLQCYPSLCCPCTGSGSAHLSSSCRGRRQAKQTLRRAQVRRDLRRLLA